MAGTRNAERAQLLGPATVWFDLVSTSVDFHGSPTVLCSIK